MYRIKIDRSRCIGCLTCAQAGIAGSIRKGHITVQGTPAIEAKNFARSSVVYKKLPEVYATVLQMQKEIEELKQLLNKDK